MNCRWCAATTAGLCYQHLTERMERDERLRRWVVSTVKAILIAAAAWGAYRWLQW